MKKIGVVVFVMFVIVSCSEKRFASSEALWEYLRNPKHEYFQNKTVNGVDFSIIYKPTDLLVAQELGKENATTKVDSLRNKYEKYMYFNLSMSKNNQELLNHMARNKQQFGAMVNQLAFGMEQKVHLYTSKKDTIAMADYSYPRMYGTSGATSLLLVYPKEEKLMDSEFITLSVEDLGFYTGEVKFKIPTNIISNQPKLHL